ncbi:MAG: UDP-N-acetyl-D-glucosamine dehydrogenase [Ignavibacteria bacterium GWB2_35_12]|nr:MAG: UDP-N-acetyl-D-glucosamine dehydrogenase [Ignavibacteria bacterium GWA2_35_8]OGU41588.1 MAG: UDP-N-acetyl-D-glucosamine dehydrogenase [Ignavibacteria bacterium GWB2_35_12]OGU86982.1 MAG: UDP-N-acetyl-D-glucosamine dehydrogenase [Ignavibacteria bacterium RIFOXYA2_FULL_35_10]OGV24921.1 MAG: UDP-N-acetyl-D-glucosamine dehydrogenase [Ignavibacteria bacterium RIFOXYC2_FULL_35_21]
MKTEKNENNLLKKIKEKQITIGVIGIGYVGLPLALEYAKKGIRTIGFDVDKTKIKQLNNGKNYNQDLDSKEVKKCVSEKFLSATDDFSRLEECNVVFICVPTPFTPNKEPDISYIIDSSNTIAKYLKKEQLIILKSTTFPGTTEKYLKPILEKSGLKVGKDFYLAFSPERIDPGNKKWNTSNTPVVVGGITKKCTELACAVISLAIDKVVPVSSPSIAEMEKLLENIFRSVNIALVNELAQLGDRIGVNIWEVIDAASTKPFGFIPFYPGPGIGGHCILIDPYYLAWMAREYDFVTNFITLAAEINEYMPFYVRNMIISEIAKQDTTIKKAKILILGVAFKKDVDDLRHSPALKVAELLQDENIGKISYYDPYIPEIKVNSKIYKSEKQLNQELLKKFDVVVITTDHSVFDFGLIAKNSKVVIDTRNACKNVKNRNNIILLGDGK